MGALHQAVIRRAASIAGGADVLARRLGVESDLLARWTEGRGTLPAWVFLRLVDIVLKDDIARALGDRREHARTAPSSDAAGVSGREVIDES